MVNDKTSKGAMRRMEKTFPARIASGVGQLTGLQSGFSVRPTRYQCSVRAAGLLQVTVPEPIESTGTCTPDPP
jgi:hypothetical protein